MWGVRSPLLDRGWKQRKLNAGGPGGPATERRPAAMDVSRAGSGLHRQGQGPQGPLNSPEPEPLNSPEPEGPRPGRPRPGHCGRAASPKALTAGPPVSGSQHHATDSRRTGTEWTPPPGPPGRFSPGRILAGQAARDATEWKPLNGPGPVTPWPTPDSAAMMGNPWLTMVGSCPP